jgi:hypothetical protein
MYGGGPCSTEGGDAGRESRPRGKSIAAATGSAAHATTTLNVWTGSIFAFATASCGRAVSVVQQSFALSCEAHVSSPSLQHAMCDIGTDTSGAHATHNDQPNVAATAHASMRTAAPGNRIAFDCRRDFGVCQTPNTSVRVIADFRQRSRSPGLRGRTTGGPSSTCRPCRP